MSWGKIKDRKVELSNLLKEYFPLCCDSCGKDLLQSKAGGVFALVEKTDGDSLLITDAYCACHGECDRTLEQMYYNRDGAITSWHEISDMMIPRYYLEELIGISDKMRYGAVTYRDEAYSKIRNVFIRLAQLVMRKHLQDEEKRMLFFDMIR